ncbi:MAG: carbohydrate kinase [Flavobacteriaceae bacterium]|nr:carbohydrate kinase [Flavobacteriaceae bacterium]
MTKSIVCFGEVLWDVFPTHKKIGGAPLNVALRLHALGADVCMISSIGNDELGEKLLEFVKGRGLDHKAIQINEQFKTGKVKVMLDAKGSATYDIMFPRAWDHIALSEENKNLVCKSDAMVFGSLVGRGETSRDTLYDLLKLAPYKIFDINLREPYYTQGSLEHLMREADFIKFNDDELFEIAGEMGSKYNSIEQNIRFISEVTNTTRVCVTKGQHGAVLLYDQKFYYNSGYLVKVVDTVGAGDSFLATLTYYLLNGEDPQKAVDYACAVGALVAQNEGANPDISAEEIERFVNPYS